MLRIGRALNSAAAAAACEGEGHAEVRLQIDRWALL